MVLQCLLVVSGLLSDVLDLLSCGLPHLMITVFHPCPHQSIQQLLQLFRVYLIDLLLKQILLNILSIVLMQTWWNLLARRCTPTLLYCSACIGRWWPLPSLCQGSHSTSWAPAWVMVANWPTGFSSESDDEVQVEFGPSTLNGVAGTSRFIFYTTRNLYMARVPMLQMQEHSGTRYTRQPTQSHNLRSKRAIARSQTRFCCAGRAKRERKIATPLDVMHNAMKSRKLNGLTV